MRRDALTGEWVAVIGSRQGRPNLPSTDCPFCVGGLESPEPYDVRAFQNRWPSLAPGEALPPEALGAQLDPTAFQQLPTRGTCEVVLYSPQHDASFATLGAAAARRIVDLWADRTERLMARPEVEYVLVFENRGAEVGATIPHPHGQIYAFPFVPPVVARERETAAAASTCTVCAEVEREAAAGERLVCRAGEWHAWVPFASAFSYGMSIASTSHVLDLPSLGDEGRDTLAAVLVDALGRYETLFDEPMPYMMWIHQGEPHLHVHLAPPWRRSGVARYVAAGEVGSGTYFNPVPPEDAAAALRQAGTAIQGAHQHAAAVEPTR